MARPVNRSSPIRDLIQVLSLLKVEKLLSALAVLTGKVKKYSQKCVNLMNACWSQAAELSAAV